MESGFIEVTAKIAKSSRRRLVTIMPNLAAWLRPFAKESGLAFTPQGYTWCLNVFSFADDYLDGPEELARYFGVHRVSIYYWFENPKAPARTPDNRFHVATWREFVRNHTRTEADAAGKLGSSFFAALAVSASREHRRYFRTEADALTYADKRNRERLAKEVRLEDVANVVDFKAAADRHEAAPATAAK